MEPQITGKNVKLMPALRQYIERKLDKLNRHLPNILELKVEIAEEKTKSPQQRFVVQITIDSNGTLLRGEERGEDMFTAVDKAAAIMDRRIERYKGKLYDKGRDSVRSQSSEEVATTDSEEKVTKVKRLRLTPMAISEAIDQMELLGHDFFLFHNHETNEINLLYRRKDGNYGLIEPKLE